MSDFFFLVLMLTVVLHILGTLVLVKDLETYDPEFYKSINGMGVFFNPIKQFELIAWIVTRKYLKSSDSVIHRYDLYLLNLAVFVVSFTLYGVTM